MRTLTKLSVCFKEEQFHMKRATTMYIAILLSTTLALTAPAARAQTGTFTSLHSFDNTEGPAPVAGLVQGSDGNFYGTTRDGGPNSNGAVFKITASGDLNVLHMFSGQDGDSPVGGMVQGVNGTYYGTTRDGGTNGYTGAGTGCGTIFKITSSGVLTVMHSFNGQDGSSIESTLLQARDGDLYGTAHDGGAKAFGTVFKITPLGEFTVLHSFVGTDGAGSEAGLTQTADGLLWGTTAKGGASNDGTIFKMTPSGTLTVVHSFLGTADGSTPVSSLVVGPDGDIYGTNIDGGSKGDYGVVFKVTPGGAFSVLYTFGGTDGDSPNNLILGRDGNFYGSTSKGGANNDGTVFELTPSGALTTLYSFAGTDGDSPNDLVQGKDGDFYGTTYKGGSNGWDNNGTGYGSVFKVAVSP
jgi:uncharacterized repeat protein (TIGR03803 family)